MSDDGVEFSFPYNGMVFSWDGGRYIYEWFEDSWEAMEWYGKQKSLPRTIENVIDNNISPYRSWDIYNVSPILLEFEAFKNYVINHIATGNGKRAY